MRSWAFVMMILGQWIHQICGTKLSILFLKALTCVLKKQQYKYTGGLVLNVIQGKTDPCFTLVLYLHLSLVPKYSSIHCELTSLICV